MPADYHLRYVPSRSALPHLPPPLPDYKSIQWPGAPNIPTPFSGVGRHANPAPIHPAPARPAPAHPARAHPAPANPAPANPAPVNPAPYPALDNPVSPASYPPLDDGFDPVLDDEFDPVLDDLVDPALPNPPSVNPAPFADMGDPIDPALLDPGLFNPIPVPTPASPAGSLTPVPNPDVPVPTVEAAPSPAPAPAPSPAPSADSRRSSVSDGRGPMARYILEGFDGWSPAPEVPGQSPEQGPQTPFSPAYDIFPGWEAIDALGRQPPPSLPDLNSGNTTPIAQPASPGQQEVVLTRLVDENELAALGAARVHGYAEIFEGAYRLVHEGHQILNLDNMRQVLRNDLFSGLAAATSFSLQLMREFLEERHSAPQRGVHAAVPVSLPSTIDLGSASRLNPGNAPIQNVMLTPPNRPHSPGPLSAIHNDGMAIDQVVHRFLNTFPEGHLARPAARAIIRPGPPHPNPTPLPILATIPTQRILGPDGKISDTPNMQCLEHKGHHNPACGKPTAAVCEDTTHPRPGFAVCDDCERESRIRFAAEMDMLAERLRSYACEACCKILSVTPATFQGSGRRVWGYPPEQDNVTSSKVMLSIAPFVTIGGFQGVDPLPVTGCACATKVFDRRLCSPHRLQHIIRLRQAVDSIDTFLVQTYGTTKICPNCQCLPSIDAFGFRGPAGNEGGARAYFCKGCHEAVILRNKLPPKFSWAGVVPVSPNTRLRGLVHGERSPHHPGVPQTGYLDPFKVSLQKPRGR